MPGTYAGSVPAVCIGGGAIGSVLCSTAGSMADKAVRATVTPVGCATSRQHPVPPLCGRVVGVRADEQAGRVDDVGIPADLRDGEGFHDDRATALGNPCHRP